MSVFFASISGIALGLLLIIGVLSMVMNEVSGGKDNIRFMFPFAFIPVVYVLLAAFSVEFFYGIAKCVMFGEPVFLIPSIACNVPKEKRKVFYILKYVIAVFVLISFIVGGLSKTLWTVLDFAYIVTSIALLV